jgi:hypothetical protein
MLGVHRTCYKNGGQLYEPAPKSFLAGAMQPYQAGKLLSRAAFDRLHNLLFKRSASCLPGYISPETDNTGLQLFPLVPEGIMATDRTVSAFGGGRVGNRHRFGAIGAFRPHQMKL